MSAVGEAPVRCAIDTVEVSRIERLLRETDPADLRRLFSAGELADAGDGPGRAASLAARFAAKEACQKLFPRASALGTIGPADFSVARDGYGAPTVLCSPAAEALLARQRIRGISLSLTHTGDSASAVALCLPARTAEPRAGALAWRLLPFRHEVTLANLRRVFGESLPEAEIQALARAHYAHLGLLLREFVRFRFLSTEAKRALVRVENAQALTAAWNRGKGVLLLTGHFGNWEVATVAGLSLFPEVRGRFHFVRRPIKPDWLDALVTRRFERAGFGVLSKRGSLDRMLALLERNDTIVFPFDQFANRPDGIEVEFFGQPAGTLKSLAIIALATGAPVLPAASWREPDGRHVLRFEDPLPSIECADPDEEIRRNTRAYNAALERLVLRHPEQWWWVHRRWKPMRAARKRRERRAV